jgi:CBS domain containing-hemolysin-like protein
MIWLLVIACWLVSFLFAGIETGLLALDPVRLRTRAKNGDSAAVRLERLLRNPERVLITVLLLTNAADIIALLILTHRLVRSFGPVGYALAIVIALPVYLFALNVLPRSLFRRFPLRAVARFSRLLELAINILWPVLAIGEWIMRHVFARGKSAPRLFAAREELKQITIQSERGGALSSAERAIIHNVVDFTAVKVRDVMVPRAKTVSLEIGETPVHVLQLSEQTGIDRFPVLEEAQPIGLINVFDILVDTAVPQNLREYIRRIITASESESAYRVVRRLRAARIGLAAVVDSRQQFSGIVALEDLIRHLVRG